MTENKIIESRSEGLSFCQLDDREQRVATDKIIIEGAAIVGCSMPQTEIFAVAISNQLANLINGFGYGQLTLSEIMLALLINANGNFHRFIGVDIDKIKFYGSCINVDFIASVLSNYLILRNNLDRKFQNELDGYK